MHESEWVKSCDLDGVLTTSGTSASCPGLGRRQVSRAPCALPPIRHDGRPR